MSKQSNGKANYFLAILLIISVIFGAVQSYRLAKLNYEIGEGNETICDNGYVAKIVEGKKVTCAMLRVGPAMVTHKVAAKEERKLKLSLIKEMKNENHTERKDLFAVGKFGGGWLR